MPLRFSYKRPDGGLSIVCAASIENLRRVLGDDLTVEKHRQHVVERSIPPEATDVVELPEDWTPPDSGRRAFRNAWDYADGKHFVHMDKARDIHMSRIRAARDAHLATLDVDTMKALGANNGDELDKVEAQKQQLRDLPKTLDLTKATTPDELRALWPEGLPKPGA